MLNSMQSHAVASIVAFLGVAYIWVFDVPFIATIIFTVLCVIWSAWTMIAIFRGTDELQSAGIRYGLAVASGLGVPLSIAFVMLMIITPDIQNAIASIATYGRSGLSLAATGFALGVTFTLITSCALFAIGHSVWWVSKR
ncbi:hypothetical protein N9919_00025 [Porticoccaceae bacterium]|nr:hypothetical protein [Porticoccaceae bacterium]MDC0002942.1 hypothetical protein [Porticoccaceae bacterium]